MEQSDQGRMTSTTLNEMLQKRVAAAYPELDIRGKDKVALLRTVEEAYGWSAVVALGEGIRGLTNHPVVRALVALCHPDVVVDRWMRLERFGHSRNYTTVIKKSEQDGDALLTLQHVAKDGGGIVSVNDLFIWGLLIGLMKGAEIENLEAALVGENGELFFLCGADVALPTDRLPAKTDTLFLRGTPRNEPINLVLRSDQEKDGSVVATLSELVARDNLRHWSLSDAARALAHSERSLQRMLQLEGTTFSEVVQRTRVESAQRMMTESRMSLVEIAFCTGFSDQAHFTRLFRRFSDVPPSALRDLVHPRA